MVSLLTWIVRDVGSVPPEEKNSLNMDDQRK